MSNFDTIIYHEEMDFDEYDDNVDIEVRLSNGDRYIATFFTLQNIKSLFKKNKTTGECCNGLFFWATDMIIVESLSRNNIEKTIKDIIEEGSLEHAMTKLN